MADDTVTPLATSAQFLKSAYADLSVNLQGDELDDVMIAATRMCEDAADRRLAPFTGNSEAQRAQGIDPDEYDTAGGMPLDLAGTNGLSYANALGVNSLVRHLWLNEYAPRYSEMWGPYTISRLQIVRSIGGYQNIDVQTVQGPESDTGHVWLQLGTFVPVGSLIRVTYSGGYSTVPASLVAACLQMAAVEIIDRLDPAMNTNRDPDVLRDRAIARLKPFTRS